MSSPSNGAGQSARNYPSRPAAEYFCAISPSKRSGWTAACTPLKPAPRRLRDMVRERR